MACSKEKNTLGHVRGRRRVPPKARGRGAPWGQAAAAAFVVTRGSRAAAEGGEEEEEGGRKEDPQILAPRRNHDGRFFLKGAS